MRSARIKGYWLVVALLCLMIGIGQTRASPFEQQMQPVATTDMAISIRLPVGWQFRTVPTLQYSALLAFGDTPESLQAMTTSLSGGTVPSLTQGSNGIVGIISSALYTGLNLDVAVESFFQSMTGPQSGGRVTQQQNLSFGGGKYHGQLAVGNAPATNASGYIAVFTDGNNIFVAVLGFVPAANFDANVEAQFSAMLESVQAPAEPGSITTPQQAATATPAINPPPATAVPLPTLQPNNGGATTLVRAEGDVLSIELPTGWVYEDHTVSDNVFAYGSSEAAMKSRLASAKPNLAAATPITGSGGLVILYTPSQLGLGDSFDATELMSRVLGNVEQQGFQVQGDIQLLQMDQGPLLYAQLSGVENGYIGLAFVGGQIAYITATGDAQTFATDQNMLFAIMSSIRVPAVSESGSGGGLGNPFGGNSPTATPSAGLGLPLATVNPQPTTGTSQTATPPQGGGHIVPILPTPTT